MRVHLMLLTAWAITGSDANTTLANTTVAENHTSLVSHAAGSNADTTLANTTVAENHTGLASHADGSDADTTLAKTIVTEIHTSHVSHADGSDANTMLTKTIVTEIHTGLVSHAGGGDDDKTLTKPIVTEHNTSHVSHAGIKTKLPIGVHEKTSEAHDNALPLKDAKKNTSESHVVTESLSEPTMTYIPLGNNAMHITCFSKSEVLPIKYQLFLHNHVLQEKIVHKSEPANFTIAINPGTEVYLICTAIAPSGEEKSSNKVTLRVDDSAVPEKDSEMDQKDHDSGYDHLISPQHFLTSVTREARKWNNLVLITCGPLLLVILVIVIVVSYLRSQKEQLYTSESI